MGRRSKSNHPVAQVRLVTGLYQEQFAQVIGISRDRLARIELSGAPASDWVASRIRSEFGARIPSVSTGPWKDPRPRAERIDGGHLPDSQLPIYTRVHFEAWKRQTKIIVSCDKRPGEAGWRALADVLGVMGSAIGAESILGFSLHVNAVVPAGLGAEALVKRILVASARTKGIDVLEEPPFLAFQGKPDIAVMAADGTGAGAPIGIFVIGRGGVDERMKPQVKTAGRSLLGIMKSLIEIGGLGGPPVSAKVKAVGGAAPRKRRAKAAD